MQLEILLKQVLQMVACEEVNCKLLIITHKKINLFTILDVESVWDTLSAFFKFVVVVTVPKITVRLACAAVSRIIGTLTTERNRFAAKFTNSRAVYRSCLFVLSWVCAGDASVVIVSSIRVQEQVGIAFGAESTAWVTLEAAGDWIGAEFANTYRKNLKFWLK